MIEHIEAIVDEVGSADGGAVVSLLGSLEAEPNAVLPHPGALVKRVALQPAPGQLLNARAALGDEPHPARESARELGDGLERALAGRRCKRGFVSATADVTVNDSLGSTDVGRFWRRVQRGRLDLHGESQRRRQSAGHATAVQR